MGVGEVQLVLRKLRMAFKAEKTLE